MNITFGTDGIRGTVGEWPIVPEVAHRVGRAAVKLARGLGGSSVLIGRDPRPSGVPLARAVAAGVVDAGGLPRDGGVVPTPAVQLGVASGLGTVGVMVTASHNPEADNGFKLLGRGGLKLDDASCRQVESWLGEEPPAERTGTIEDVSVAVRTAWRDRLRDLAGDLRPLEGRRIVIDCANGAAAAVRDLFLPLIPAEVLVIGTSGPVNGGVGSEHLGHLARSVLELGCAGGFAVDGDADRCRVVDERGDEVPGDVVLWRLAIDARARALAVTVMSNGALEQHLPTVRVVRGPVGDRHVRELMDREGAALGGEESGHVLFGDHPGGDGVLTGLRALCAALRAGPTLSAGFSGISLLPRKLTKVRVKHRVPPEEIVAVERARTVGLERLGPYGRVFLRYSGTEPVLRILVEGEPATAVEAVSAAVTSAASKALT
jgi:phosphoglucosamine mutase